MRVETLEDHGGRAGTTVPGWLSSLLALPRNYPVAWAIAWTVLLLSLCLAPKSVIPNEESFENTFLTRKYASWSALAVHFILFAGFVLSWLRIGGRSWRWIVVPAIGLLLAVATELAQGLPFIHRDPNVIDGVADSAGVIAALAVAVYLNASAGRE